MTWTVYECGTPVRLGNNGQVSGMITGISIRFNNLTYEVTWWDDATKKTEWFNPEELEAEQSRSLTIQTAAACENKNA